MRVESHVLSLNVSDLPFLAAETLAAWSSRALVGTRFEGWSVTRVEISAASSGVGQLPVGVAVITVSSQVGAKPGDPIDAEVADLRGKLHTARDAGQQIRRQSGTGGDGVYRLRVEIAPPGGVLPEEGAAPKEPR